MFLSLIFNMLLPAGQLNAGAVIKIASMVLVLNEPIFQTSSISFSREMLTINCYIISFF